jgi:hypothetical protein
MARKTLLWASSAWSTTCGRGNVGNSRERTADLGVGAGLMRRVGRVGAGDWRRRAEGLRTEFLRILVPYWCFMWIEDEEEWPESDCGMIDSMRRWSLT